MIQHLLCDPRIGAMGFGDLPAILVLEWWRQATPRARSLARPACVREFSVQLKWFNKRSISMNGREWLRKTPGTKLWFPHTCISSTPTHIHAHVYTHMHAHHIYIHMQKISGESRHPCFILILAEMLYFPLATIMVLGLLYTVFVMLRYFPSFPIFFRVLLRRDTELSQNLFSFLSVINRTFIYSRI